MTRRTNWNEIKGRKQKKIALQYLNRLQVAERDECVIHREEAVNLSCHHVRANGLTPLF